MKKFGRIDEDHNHMHINIKRIEAQDQVCFFLHKIMKNLNFLR